jgi:uncharacterized membrane protein
MESERVQRSRDFERFITFVDAVVAIAVTLLVLPLVDLTSQLGDGSVLALLRSHETEIGGFLLSFLVITNAWFAQHHATRGVIATDPLVSWLMVAWMLTIVILPFPTALVAQSGHQAATKIFYIGLMALTSALLSLICWAIGRNPAIRDDASKPDTVRSVASTVAFLVALAISLIFESTSYYPLLLLLLPAYLLKFWRRFRTTARGRV